jgi:HlyD family secretion protein
VTRLFGIVRRFAWLAVILVALLIGAWLRWGRPIEARVIAVDRGLVTSVAFGRGTIESQREAAVGFDLVGRISEVLVDEGSRVTIGQEIARLEPSQAVADLNAAKTGVVAARATLKRLAAEEDRARVMVAAAEREAERARSLFEKGAVAGQVRDDSQDQLRMARADLDRVLAQRAEATRSIEVASSGAAQRNVAMLRATLLAPFDGLVTRRLHEPGDTVTIGSTVLRVADTNRVYVRAALDETILPKLVAGQVAEVRFPGDPVATRGKLTDIAWEADRQTHEILVEVMLDKLDRRVAIGQRADVRIELERRDRVLRVPVAVIHHDDGGAYVFVDRVGRIAVVRPQFGLTGSDYVEVVAGLVDDDRLLIAPRSNRTLPAGRRWKAE